MLRFSVSDSARVPHNLRRYVVEQDYEQYTEVDQAVWRFVLLQTYERLQHTAHSAYRQGLAQTGISVDRIPRIAEMSECLERFGWQAVALAEIRDLNRHRTGTKTCPLLPQGFYAHLDERPKLEAVPQSLLNASERGTPASASASALLAAGAATTTH